MIDSLKRPAQNVLDIQFEDWTRMKSNVPFFDEILGGGAVCPGTLLFSGRGGAGKTSLMVQVADGFSETGLKVVYAAAEEAPRQIAGHAKRLQIRTGFLIKEVEDPADVHTLIKDEHPDVVIVDSLHNRAKREDIVMFILCHVNKKGQLAGPEELKHIGDGHLHMDYDFNPKSPTFGLRVLQLEKYRFGTTEHVWGMHMEATGFNTAFRIEGQL